MRHVIHANAAGSGYALLAGSSAHGFVALPLDRPAPEVPSAYLRARQLLDSAFESRPGTWTTAAVAPHPPELPVLAYAARTGAVDEFGRPGLWFFHGVELAGPEELPAAVAAVLALFSPTAARRLLRDLGELATGRGGELTEFARQRALALEAALREGRELAHGATGVPVSAIEHDCAGGAGVAWVRLATQQARVPTPWVIAERTGKSGNPVTYVEPGRGGELRASQLLGAPTPVVQVTALPSPVPIAQPPQESQESTEPTRVEAGGRGTRVWLVAASVVGLGVGVAGVGGYSVGRRGHGGEELSKLHLEVVQTRTQNATLQQKLGEEFASTKQLASTKSDLQAQLNEAQTKLKASEHLATAMRQAADRASEEARQAQATARLAGDRAAQMETMLVQASIKADNARHAEESVRIATERRLSVERETGAAERTTLLRELRPLRYAATLREAETAFLARRFGELPALLAPARPGPGEEDPRGFECYLLQAAAGGANPVAGPTHKYDVNAVRFLPKGFVVSASDDETIAAWEVGTAKVDWTTPSHNGVVKAVYELPQRGGEFLGATGKWDPTAKRYTIGRIIRWSLSAKGEVGKPLDGHSGLVLCLAVARDGKLAASGSKDGTVNLWDLDRWVEKRRWKGHTGEVSAVAFHPAGTSLATGAAGEVWLWDPTGGDVPRGKLPGHGGQVHSLAYSPDGAFLASVCDDGIVRLFEGTTHQLAATLVGHEGAVRALAWSPDGQRLATGGGTGWIYFWDVPKRRLLLRLPAHTGGVRGLAFHPDGPTLASGGADGQVKLWRAPRNP